MTRGVAFIGNVRPSVREHMQDANRECRDFRERHQRDPNRTDGHEPVRQPAKRGTGDDHFDSIVAAWRHERGVRR